jgi:glycosyltransferase involved in cell wall biosynthesis
VHIEKVLNFFVNANPLDKELLIIDGGSTDGTREIVNIWTGKYSNIRLLENPDRYVPFALNIAIKNSTGNPIIRIDAHSDYAPDYFEKILETFETTGADIVGGPYLTKAVTHLQAAVANAISNPFGIGNSKAHNPDFKGYVDSVPYGAWKRELFKQAGYFDERFKRNQDDEFHYRAKSLGKKIFLNPEIKLWYYPRNSLYSLFRQYYEYGIYKPLVLKKIKSEIKFRHIIPSLFIIYLILLPLSFLTSYFLLPLLIYFITYLVVSFASKGGLKTKLWSILVYPTIHKSYGIGFIVGLFKIKRLSGNQSIKKILC